MKHGIMKHDAECACCVCEERRIRTEMDLEIKEQATEIKKLQSRVAFLESAFSQFSHEVTLEDLDSGRVAIFVGETMPDAKKRRRER